MPSTQMQLLQYGVIGLAIFVIQFVATFLLNAVGLGISTASGVLFYLGIFLVTGFSAIKAPPIIIKELKR